jgi:hypothetical protein
MTEAAPAAVPATPSPSPGQAAASDILGNGMRAMEMARAEIETLKGDKDFYKLLQAKDPAATQRWSNLHKAGYPAPVSVATPEDVGAQAAARNEEQWNSYLAACKALFPLTPEQEAEIRNGVIRADLHQQAREQKDRLVKDKEFYKRLMAGDGEANKRWGLLLCALSLRPVQPA